MQIYDIIIKNCRQKKKQIAVLVDPDKIDEKGVINLATLAQKFCPDFIFVGGSLLTNGSLSNVVSLLKMHCTIPVILFPGKILQIEAQADAMLLLSLVSGRNAELLIGNHVVAAPILKEKKLQTISCGYMLIESGNITTALYMSNTQPIPNTKKDIAACTALAATMLGMKTIYMDAGSGAALPVPASMIEAVSAEVDVPLIVGGGIKTVQQAQAAWHSGADIVVVGNAIETDILMMEQMIEAAKVFNA